MNAFRVDELADVHDERGFPFEKLLHPFPGVGVVGARLVRGGDVFERCEEFLRAGCFGEGFFEGGFLLGAASVPASQRRKSLFVEGVRIEKIGVHAAGEGEGFSFHVREILDDGSRSVGGGRDYFLRPGQTFAGDAHIPFAFPGQILEAASVDDGQKRRARPFEGVAGYERPRNRVVRHDRLDVGMLHHRSDRLGVSFDVKLELVIGEVEESFHSPSRIVIVYVYGEEVADVRFIENAPPRIWAFLFTFSLDAGFGDDGPFVHEIVVRGDCFLAEEMDGVAFFGEGAGEVLDVYVASGAGEHVSVGHEESHGGEDSKRGGWRRVIACKICGRRFLSFTRRPGMARTKNAKVPEVGAEVPEFNLPSAQGGVLRLGMRTATGPVIVAFFRGEGDEEDISYFKKLAGKEDEINLALGDVVGIGVVESAAAREFAKATGMKSYILYDYAKVATPAWGLLERDKKNGDHARAATFLIGTDNKVVEAWMDDRPNPDELLAKITEITGLPKEPEEEVADEGDEKPKKGKAAKKDESGESGESSEASEKPKGEKPSPEDREKRRAERKAAKEGDSGGDGGDSEAAEKPKGEKPSPEEREKRRAERKAARESGEGSKAGGDASDGESAEGSETDEKQAEAGGKPETKGEASGGDAGESAKEDGTKPEAKEEKQPGAKGEPESGAEGESGEAEAKGESSSGGSVDSAEDGDGAKSEGEISSDEENRESSGGGPRGEKEKGA